MSEAAMASMVAAWLGAQHWEVYPEVRLAYMGQRADLVGLQSGRTWVVECKKSLSLGVIGQARCWQPFTNWVSIAVPYVSRNTRSRACAWTILGDWGIGLLSVSGDTVIEHIQPRLNRGRMCGRARELLHEGQQAMGVAGSQNHYWTPFKNTCRELARYVADHPGSSMKDAVYAIPHHYRKATTATSCLLGWLRRGLIPSIRSNRIGRGLKLFPAEATP